MRLKTITVLVEFFLLLLVLFFLLIFFTDKIIENKANSSLYDNLEEIPFNQVGVVLGTSKYLSSGGLNPYFTNRINAAVELYKAKKIKLIIVSGDNATNKYNEPRIMKKELVKKGIPSKYIFFDFAGFRTLDSVIRANKVFGQESFTIISQKFQNERALFIAKHFDYSVVAYNAKGEMTFSLLIREYLARLKCVIDIFVLKKEPKFLGEPENIEQILNLPFYETNSLPSNLNFDDDKTE